MLSLATMSSNTPRRWNGPLQQNNELPPISLLQAFPLASTPSRQTIDSGGTRARQASLPSLKLPVPDRDEFRLEEQQIQAIPNGSTSGYMQSSSSQEPADASRKRKRIAASPWFNPTGKSIDRTWPEGTSQRNTESRCETNNVVLTSGVAWFPGLSQTSKPQDISMLPSSAKSSSIADCGICCEAARIVPDLISGLQNLSRRLTRAAKGRIGDCETGLETYSAVDRNSKDIVACLEFSIRQIHEIMEITKEMIININLEDRGNRLILRRPWEEDGSNGRDSRANSVVHEDTRYILEQSSSREQALQNIKVPSPASRRLPSPNLLQYPEVLAHESATSQNTAQSQDLQRQLDTKSLAHSKVQGEHEKLLSNYTLIKAKCLSLESKANRIDTELGNVLEDRAGLQVQVETLEQQVAELQISREEARKDCISSRSQYMQIVALSSKLQMQCADELKKYKEDRQIWSAEKAELQKKYQKLEKSRGPNAALAATLTAGGENMEHQDTIATGELDTMSFSQLKEEIMLLRRSVRTAAAVIQTFRNKGIAIQALVHDLDAIAGSIVCPGVKPESDSVAAK